MPRGRCFLRRVLAPGVIAVLVGALLVTSTPAPAGARTEADPLLEVRPIDVPSPDPVLDGVEVEPTRDTRAADSGYQNADDAVRRSTDRLAANRDERTQLIAQAATAATQVRNAQGRFVDAAAERGRQEDERTRRRTVEVRRRAGLADERAELRRVAAAIFATGPSDDWSFMGDTTDINAGVRRDAIRQRSASEQTRRVADARRPWRAARGARLAQDRRVGRVIAAEQKASSAVTLALAVRDNLDGLVRQADATIATAETTLAKAEIERVTSAKDRRRARLTARVSGLDMPLVALDAYWEASRRAPCAVPWWLLAGVGRIESGHGTAHGARLDEDGTTSVHILGIPLDGRPGTLAIRDTDGGRLDDDPVWDRAIGPMQFIPGTWRRWASDDNGDGKADPHNLYDATGGAAAYLCFGHNELLTEPAQRSGLFAYNRSVFYANQVLATANRYRNIMDLPDVAPPLPIDPKTNPAPPTGN